MKKILYLFILQCLLGNIVHAQIKEGLIRFTMNIDTDPSKGMNPMGGSTDVTLWFKNDKTLTEMTTPVYTMKTLADGNGMLVLMDAMGQKSFFRKPLTTEQKAEAGKTKPVVTYTKEKKKILGYECTKALISFTNPKTGTLVMNAWITDKLTLRNMPIGPFNEEIVSSFKGTCLAMEMEMKGIKTKMTATEISTKPIPDKVFQLSTTGYTERKK